MCGNKGIAARGVAVMRFYSEQIIKSVESCLRKSATRYRITEVFITMLLASHRRAAVEALFPRRLGNVHDSWLARMNNRGFADGANRIL